MTTVTLRFYEELNDFLPLERRKVNFTINVVQKTSIKDLIESLGVPHTEIELILVNGKSVDFNYLLQEQDYISVFPVFEALDISDHLLTTGISKGSQYLRVMFTCNNSSNNFHPCDSSHSGIN